MRNAALATRFARPFAGLVLFALVLLAGGPIASPAAAQSTGTDAAAAPGTGGFALDLQFGATSGPGDLGITTGAPEGYFRLGELGSAPVLGLGVLFPETVLGLRPRALVSYAVPSDVGGSWTPCDPGLACPAVFIPLDASADRLEATVGAELPILASAGPVRPYASVGVGVRRYGVSWEAISAFENPFLLRPGSHGETDFVARFGLGLGVDLGGFEALLEGAMGLSRFGPGQVPIPGEVLALYSGPTIDLRRESLREYALTVGVRKHLR